MFQKAYFVTLHCIVGNWLDEKTGWVQTPLDRGANLCRRCAGTQDDFWGEASPVTSVRLRWELLAGPEVQWSGCGHWGVLSEQSHVQTVPHVGRHAVLSGELFIYTILCYQQYFYSSLYISINKTNLFRGLRHSSYYVILKVLALSVKGRPKKRKLADFLTNYYI